MRSMGKDGYVRLHVRYGSLGPESAEVAPSKNTAHYFHPSPRKGRDKAFSPMDSWSRGGPVSLCGHQPLESVKIIIQMMLLCNNNSPPPENGVCFRLHVAGTHFSSPRWPALEHPVFMPFSPCNLLLRPWDLGSPPSVCGH